MLICCGILAGPVALDWSFHHQVQHCCGPTELMASALLQEREEEHEEVDGAVVLS